jgi:hypothetical protein
MSTFSSNGEVFGARALYAAIVVGAVLLLMGAIYTPSPAVQHAQSPANATVAMAAHPGAALAG